MYQRHIPKKPDVDSWRLPSRNFEHCRELVARQASERAVPDAVVHYNEHAALAVKVLGHITTKQHILVVEHRRVVRMKTNRSKVAAVKKLSVDGNCEQISIRITVRLLNAKTVRPVRLRSSAMCQSRKDKAKRKKQHHPHYIKCNGDFPTTSFGKHEIILPLAGRFCKWLFGNF